MGAAPSPWPPLDTGTRWAGADGVVHIIACQPGDPVTLCEITGMGLTDLWRFRGPPDRPICPTCTQRKLIWETLNEGAL